MMYVIRMLRRIFEPKREEIAREWRRLQTRNFVSYTSQNIIRVIKLRVRLAGNMTRIRTWEIRVKILFVKPEGKRPLGKPRRRWKLYHK
jgi:hypothetical protein